MIVLYWVTEHFPDFEGNEEMTDFLDWFEARLLEDVSPAITCVCFFTCVTSLLNS